MVDHAARAHCPAPLLPPSAEDTSSVRSITGWIPLPINRIFSPGRARSVLSSLITVAAVCLSVLVVGDLAPVKDVDSRSLFGISSVSPEFTGGEGLLLQ